MSSPGAPRSLAAIADRPATPAERAQFWLLIAAICLPLLVLLSASIISYRHHMAESQDRLIRTLDIVREHANKVFETVDLVRSQVDQSVSGLSRAEIQEREEALHLRLKVISDSLDQISGIYVFDAAGVPLVAANFFPVPANPSAATRDYFTAHRDGTTPAGTPYVSDLLRSLANQQTSFFIVSTRLAGDPAIFRGAIAISIEPSYFRTFYAQVRLSGVDSITLLRPDGSILARDPATSGPVRVPATSGFMTATAQDPERGSYETTSSVDGVTRSYAYRRLADLPIYVTAGIDRATTLADWRAAMTNHLLFGIPATIGLIVLSMIALRRTRQEALASRQFRDEVARREAVETQLRQAQKMEAVGQLTGGLAHDFNNLLTIVIGSLDLLAKRMPDGEARNRRLVDNALDGANRAARLTSRLLSFSRQQPLDPKPLDVNRAVADMADLFRRTLGETIRTEAVLSDGLWRAKVDRNGMESALLNLVVNARDAMGQEGGRLTIETSNVYLDEAYAAAQPEVRPGQYVLVAVTDTGTGMPGSVIDRAFDPFFTTKEPGKGTGLGLSQVYGFLRQSGGHVAIDSAEGAGTTVKLYLPRHAGPEQDEVAPSTFAESRPRSDAAAPLVLLVEDEDGVRAFAAEALTDLGYRVLTADGPSAALRCLAEHETVSILLTDVVMPEGNGRALAERALKRRPELRVLFMTGYARNAIVHNGILDEGTNLILKPFTQAQLGAKLLETLAAQR